MKIRALVVAAVLALASFGAQAEYITVTPSNTGGGSIAIVCPGAGVGELLYNNAGTCDGTAGWTTDGTVLTGGAGANIVTSGNVTAAAVNVLGSVAPANTGIYANIAGSLAVYGGGTIATFANGGATILRPLNLSFNAAASGTNLLFNSTLFTGGTGTTTFPQMLFQPTGTSAVTSWSTSGTIIGANVVSGFAGNFIEMRIAGGATQYFAVTAAGNIINAGNITSAGIIAANSPTSFVALNTGSYNWNGRGVLTSPAAGSIQMGLADAAAPAAQTLRVQSVVAGTSNTAGQNWTQIGSLSTGSGTSGSLIFQVGVAPGAGSPTVQATATTALTIAGETLNATFVGRATAATFDATSSNLPPNGMNLPSANALGFTSNTTQRMTLSSSGNLTANTVGSWALMQAASSSTVPVLIPNRSDTTTGIGAQASGNVSVITGGAERQRVTNSGTFLITAASDAATTNNTVCRDTTSGQLYIGSGALGICLGTSGRQFKTDLAPMVAGIDELMKIDFVNYRYRHGYGDSGANVQYGTTAQAVEAAIPALARHDVKGETINFDSGALLFVGLRAIQQLKEEINELKRAAR